MSVTAFHLVTRYNEATDAVRAAAALADRALGQASAYPALSALIAAARDAYAEWAETCGRETVAAEVLELGRIMRRYLDSLADDDVYALGDEVMPYARHVSAEAVRWVLNTAYPDDHPGKAAPRTEALRRHAETCGAVALDAPPLGALLFVLGMPNIEPGAEPIDIVAELQREQAILDNARREQIQHGQCPPASGDAGYEQWARRTLAQAGETYVVRNGQRVSL